jgi:hypothetical protein
MHICYLGSISEGFEKYNRCRRRFWETANRNLDKAGVTGVDRERITAALESVVRRPDEARKAEEAVEAEE